MIMTLPILFQKNTSDLRKPALKQIALMNNAIRLTAKYERGCKVWKFDRADVNNMKSGLLHFGNTTTTTKKMTAT